MAKLVLMDGPTFVVSDESGDLAEADAADGLYHHDTRFLSGYQLLLNGEPLAFLSAPQADSAAATVHLTNRAFGDVLPQTISVRRTRFLRGGLHERVELTNYNRFPLPLRLGLRVAADFRDMFDVRGFARAEPGTLLAPKRLPEGVELRYQGRDGVLRTTRVVADPPFADAREIAWDATLPARRGVSLPDAGRSVDAPEQHVEEVELVLERELLPQQPLVVTVLIEPCLEDDLNAAPPFEAGRETVESHRREWLDRRVSRFGCSVPAVCRLLERGADDLYMLTQWRSTGPVPVAGIPWFACPFGRDSIVTALAALPLAPELAVGTLRFLAAHQGSERNDWRDEEPGKIMHELRSGEMARLGAVPYTPYYGSVDATPLFLVLLGAAARWLGPGIVDELWPNAERALAWIEQHGDRDGDGLIEYETRSPLGIRNQGWKDSPDSATHADGGCAEPPIALIEVQAYAYAARVAMAGLYRGRGELDRADQLERDASRLAELVRGRFWLPELSAYAEALDRDKRPVAVVSSNAAHALWGGIASASEASALAARLGQPDMLSGWGLRTLASGAPSFNPMSYHNGSIWPHDNAIAVAGLAQYGFHELAGEIAGQVFAAAQGFRGLRLPELYCGFQRESTAVKVPAAYPVSCSPQAWAAAAPFMMLGALLGLDPDALGGRLVLRPRLPEWLDWVEVDGLRVGEGRASFWVGRDGAIDVRRADGLDVVVG